MSLTVNHLRLTSAEDVHELFRLLDYNVYDPAPFEDDELDEVLELDEGDRPAVQRAYIVADQGGHVVWLFEVDDTRLVRLRGLAHNALQRGSALVIVTKPDYKEVIFADPRYAGNPVKSNVRVSKLQVLTADPTRHDADTLNQIYARNRTGQQIYDAQAEAFNVEKTTRKFYREYHTFYERTRDLTVQYNPHIREFHDADKLHAFVQRLLGRLMFLYFLQRKGWLGGERNFLSRMFVLTYRQHADEIGDNDESFYYYRKVLEPLFFETMNTKRPDNITKWEGIRIPYLNGGLFDGGRDPSGIISLPDSLFDPNSSEGVLAFFNRYNFTVADDTPLEQDVAVDPEMLGKVFENLLEERDRGQSGSFYTPRAIVSYMCQEALAGYLEESAKPSPPAPLPEGEGSFVTRETVRTLFNPDSPTTLSPEQATAINAALDTLTVLDPAVGSGSFLIGMMNEILTLKERCYDLLPSPREAVGEGLGVREKRLADWKEHIIGHTLYGVDIKPEAIEIAQLRLWLAMVVNQTLEDARPLPNLDYKLMAGNSLIETIDGEPVLTEAAMQQFTGDDVDWQYVDAQMDMFRANPQQARMALFDDEKQAQAERVKLGEMRREFFRATPERRRQLRSDITAQEHAIIGASLGSRMKAIEEQIAALEKKAAQAGGKWKKTDANKRKKLEERAARLTDALRELDKPEPSLPFFLYRLHFSEIFERKGGFDIVVANPPYVRIQTISEYDAEEIKASYQSASGNFDLYVPFVEQSIGLSNLRGNISYILPHKFFNAKYGANLRHIITRGKHLNRIIHFGHQQIFDEASTYTCILILSIKPRSKFSFVAVSDLGHWLLNQQAPELLMDAPETSKDVWLFAASVSDTFQKLQSHEQTLEDVTERIFQGLKTGADQVYIVEETSRRNGHAQIYSKATKSHHEIEVDLLYPLIKGGDSSAFRMAETKRRIIFPYINGELIPSEEMRQSYPLTWHYLSGVKTILDKRESGKFKGKHWYQFSRNQALDVIQAPKLFTPDIAPSSYVSMDEKGGIFFTGGTSGGYGIIPNEDYSLEYILALINSNALEYFLQHISSPMRGGWFSYEAKYIKHLPIPDAPTRLRDQIADLARQCLAAAADVPDKLPALEARLNALVYQAYGLDEDDIRVIEGHLNE